MLLLCVIIEVVVVSHTVDLAIGPSVASVFVLILSNEQSFEVEQYVYVSLPPSTIILDRCQMVSDDLMLRHRVT